MTQGKSGKFKCVPKRGERAEVGNLSESVRSTKRKREPIEFILEIVYITIKYYYSYLFLLQSSPACARTVPPIR